jgi:16S rRNA processing protein RimM
MEYLATGVLKAPHGIHGYLKLHSFSEEFSHLAVLGEVSLRKDGKEKRTVIEDYKIMGREFLIKFSGVDNPEDARILNGWEMWVPRESAAPLGEGEFYVADLATCSLVSEGAVVGRVVGVIDGAQALLLEVESSADQNKYLVPFMSQYIGAVDLERKEMELLAPWLLA